MKRSLSSPTRHRRVVDPWRRLTTEAANPASRDLDLLSPTAIVRLINREDRRAVASVGEAAPAIAAVARRFADALIDHSPELRLTANSFSFIGRKR